MTAYLHQRFPELRDKLGHFALGSEPTPVRPLSRLANGTSELWVKNDGDYGDGGWGGNKIRKLEWLLPEAKRLRRRAILTFGGLGTHWGLATALYAREFGLQTVLALVDQPIDEHVETQLARLYASGADIHRTRNKARTLATIPYLYARHRRPYVLPVGGSSPLGALGYVEASFELAAQIQAGAMPMPSSVVTPVGSGGTVAGLFLGLALAGLADTQVIGIVVNDQLRLDQQSITSLAHRAARLLHDRGADLPFSSPPAERLTLLRDWLGAGYGQPTSQGEHALQLARSAEALELEPVYTAKTMAAVLELGAQGRLPEGPTLYLHTHGPREC